MNKDEKHDEDLAWDIGFALWNGRFWPKRARSIEEYRVIGRAVVKQLRLCMWTFERRPPSMPHSSGQDVSERKERKGDDNE